LTSNVGGIPELNIEGETGFLCEIGDIETMTAKAKFILADENLANFKKNALARAKLFDVTAILPLYEAFYQKTIEKVYSTLKGRRKPVSIKRIK